MTACDGVGEFGASGSFSSLISAFTSSTDIGTDGVLPSLLLIVLRKSDVGAVSFDITDSLDSVLTTSDGWEEVDAVASPLFDCGLPPRPFYGLPDVFDLSALSSPIE